MRAGRSNQRVAPTRPRRQQSPICKRRNRWRGAGRCTVIISVSMSWHVSWHVPFLLLTTEAFLAPLNMPTVKLVRPQPPFGMSLKSLVGCWSHRTSEMLLGNLFCVGSFSLVQVKRIPFNNNIPTIFQGWVFSNFLYFQKRNLNILFRRANLLLLGFVLYLLQNALNFFRGRRTASLHPKNYPYGCLFYVSVQIVYCVLSITKINRWVKLQVFEIKNKLRHYQVVQV